MPFIKKIVFFGLFLLFFLPFSSAFADFQLENGAVQLSVGNFLLDILESNANIDQIDFNGDNSFIVTLSANQRIKIGSSDRRRFIYSTTYSTYITTTCDASRSTITITTPGGIGSIPITIELGDPCLIDSGGGGGGSLGTLVPPPPPTPIGGPTPPIPPLLLPPGGVPGVLTPPPPAPAPTPAPQPTPLPFIPPVLSPIIEAIKEIFTPAPQTVEAVQAIIQGIVGIFSDFGSAGIIISGLRTNTAVTTTLTYVVQPLVIAVGIFGSAVLALTAVQASAAIAIQSVAFLNFFDLARFFSLGLLQFKKRKPWGRVLEKLTGKPVPAALVQVFDSEFKKLKDTQITDAEGRFGSFVGAGKYFIKVSKDGFLDKETETITIEKEGQALDLEIIIAPIEQELSFAYLKKIGLLDVLKRLLDAVSPTLLVIGTLLSLIALVIIPSLLNYIVFTIYIALDVLKIYFIVYFVKPFGKVLDANTLQPLSLAIIRIFDLEKQLLLATKATDEEGRFNFLIAPGKYYLTCIKAGYSPFRSEPTAYTSATLETGDIKLQKSQPAPAPATPMPSPTISPQPPTQTI